MVAPFSGYEEKKRKQILTRTTWITVIACLVFGALNLNMSSWSSAAIILSSAVVCMSALWFNHKGYQTHASLLVCAGVLIAITYGIYDGDGLLDPGIIGYPLFILLGTLLLDKHFTPWLTLASILCLSFVGVMQANGFLHPTIHINDASNLLPISIFLVVGALIVWVILDNLQKNYEKLRASENELYKSYELTIQGWSKALDIRDVSTGDHSHRVVEMAEKLARNLNYPEQNMQFFRYGAYLHDIGKIGIPDAILLKAGPLTAEEWEIMRTHPLKAEELLIRIPYLKPALDIPKYHHEHWDGSGYPYHLRGREIPYAARIFTVVDVWDALTNVRPYREPWSNERARDFIAEQAGKQFDPDVVAEFLQIIK